MGELIALRDRTAALLETVEELEFTGDIIRAAVLPTTDDELPAVLVSARQLRRVPEGRANIGPLGYICTGTLLIVIRRRAADPSDLEQDLLDQAEVVTEALLNDGPWLREIEAVASLDTRIQPSVDGNSLMGDAIIELACTWREDFGAYPTDQFQTVRVRLEDEGDDVAGATGLYPP